MARERLRRSESRREAGRTARENVKSGRYLQKQETANTRKVRQPLRASLEAQQTQEFEARPSQAPSTFMNRQAMNEQRLEQPTMEKPTMASPSVSPSARNMQARRMEQGTEVKPTLQQARQERNIQQLQRVPSMEQPTPLSRNEQIANKMKNIPVVGQYIKGMDVVAEKTKPFADIAQEYYTPGGGLSTIMAAEQAGANLFAKFAPNVSRLGRHIVTGGAIGAAESAGQSLAAHPERGLEGARQAAGEGFLYGGAFPIAGKVVKAGVQGLKKYATKTAEDIIGSTLGRANEIQPPTIRRTPNVSPNVPEAAPAPEPTTTPAPTTVPKQVDPRVEQIDADFERQKRFINESVDQGIRTREEANKQIKGMAMRNAAEKRQIIQGDSLVPVEGGLTAKELADKIAKLKSNYTGKKVTVNGQNGTVTKMSFGKVGVRFDDGTEKFYDPSDVQPAEDIDSLIRQQETKQTPQPEPTPTTQPVRPTATASAGAPKGTAGIRSNPITQRESGAFSDELTGQIKDQQYDVAHNVDTVERANKAMKNASQAENDFYNNSFINKGDTAGHTALGYRLMQEFDAKGEYDRAIRVSEKLAKDLTQFGQGSQAASIIYRLSPEGQLMALTRRAERNNMSVTPTDRQAFKEAAEEFKEANGAEIRTDALSNIMAKLDAGQEPTAEDLALITKLVERAKKFLPEEKPKAKKREKIKKEETPKAENAVMAKLQKAEDEAWARIKKGRNVGFAASSGGSNDFLDYAIIATNRVAKGLVNQSNHVGELVRMFGEEVRPIATKIFNAAKNRVAKDPQLRNLRNKVTTAEDVVKQFEKKMQPRPADLQKIKELSEQLSKLDNMSKKDADIAMQKIMVKYEKASMLDKVQALRYLMMLGNTATQSVNIASGLIQPSVEAVGNIAGTLIDSVLSKALKQERTRTIYGMNPVKFLGDYIKNAKVGAQYNWHGLQPSGLNSADEVRGLALTGKLAKATGLNLAERSLKAVAGGADYGVYKTVFDSEIRKQGYLDAKKKGIKGSKEIKKHIANFVKEPSPDAIAIADRQGKRTTFQSEQSLGGKAANVVNSASPALKFAGKAVVPFIRTPANIASTAVSLTPAGFLKGAIRLARAKTPSDRSDAIRDMGLGIVGGAGLTSLGYALSDLGLITDENESGNANYDKLQEQAGGGVFRFNQSGLVRALTALYNGEGYEGMKKAAKYQENDSTFDYNKLQPVAFPVAAGASFEKARDEGKTAGQALGKATKSAGGSLMAMSALKSIQDITNTGFNKTSADESAGILQRVAESYLKSFSPSLIAQEARREDTTQRQPSTKGSILQNVGQYYQSRTPDVLGKFGVPTSSQLPARLTTLGQEKKNPSGIAGTYANPYRSQEQIFNKAAQRVAELIQRTGGKGLAPSAPDKKISGKMKSTRKEETVELEPKRYEQYQKDVGKEITDKINALPSDLTDAQLTNRITMIYETVKDKYRNRLRKELGMYMKE